jgi:hypothetical protein
LRGGDYFLYETDAETFAQEKALQILSVEHGCSDAETCESDPAKAK